LTQQEKFDALLPLYLTASHFNRALPHMAPLLSRLAPQAVGAGGATPPPETWLEVLPAILNTQVCGWCEGREEDCLVLHTYRVAAP